MGRKPSRLCAFEILISTLTCLINVVSNKCVGRNFYPKIINMQVLITVHVEIFYRINKRVGPNKHGGKSKRCTDCL